MDGWNTTFLFGRPMFRGCVSLREGQALVFVRWLFLNNVLLWLHFWKCPEKNTNFQVATAGKDGSVFVLNVACRKLGWSTWVLSCIVNRHALLSGFRCLHITWFTYYMVFEDCNISDFMLFPEQTVFLFCPRARSGVKQLLIRSVWGRVSIYDLPLP